VLITLIFFLVGSNKTPITTIYLYEFAVVMEKAN